jgi:hypothetical protein
MTEFAFWTAFASALAAITAAIIAARQASNARRSAALLDSRSHRIALIDAQASELREAYKNVVRSLNDMADPLKTTGTAPALEILAACDGASAELVEAADRSRDAILQTVTMGQVQDNTGFDLGTLRAAYRSSQARLMEMRASEATDRRR